jgi:hypothetical protein
MNLRLLVPLVLCSAPLFAQSTPAAIYAESFRQGPTRVIEDQFEVKLTPQDPIFRKRIKDSHGVECYALSITPLGPEHGSDITSWQVKLADLRQRSSEDVLLTTEAPSFDPGNNPSNDPGIDPRDILGYLNPSNSARVLWPTKRIIKVESFYLVLLLKARRFNPPDSPYLESMTVSVELTNTDPRTAGDTQK